MATKNKIEIIIAATDAGVTAAFAKVNKSLKAADDSSKRFGKGMNVLQAPVNALTSTFARLGLAVGAVFAAKSFLKVGDEYTNINARLKLVTSSSEELDSVQKALYATAQETGTAYAANAGLISKLGMAMKGVKPPMSELLQINKAVNKSLIVSGASSAEAASFVLQFGQAMGSGVLAGDEFRGMMESNSYFGQQLAAALDTDIAGLRALSKQGKLTTEVIREAIPKMLQQIDEDFAKMPLTIGRAMTMLSNAFGKLVNGSNEATGATGRISAAIKSFVTYLEQNGAQVEAFVVNLVKMGGEALKTAWNYKELIGSILGGLIAVSAIASLTTAFMALNAAMVAMSGVGLAAVLLNPVTAAIAAVGLFMAAAGAAFSWLTSESAEVQAGIAANKAEADAAHARSMANNEKMHARSLETIRKVKADNAALTSSSRENEEKRKKYQGDALAAMEKKYREYAAEVRRLQDQIMGREQSLADQLRTMARTGMSEINAWTDLKKNADEYADSARKAAEAGDFVTALASADRAKEMYAQLNSEVKDGDRVMVSQAEALKTAMDGVKTAGQLGVDILKEQQKAAAAAMDELVDKTGFQDLSAGMDDAEKQWLDNWSKMKAASLQDIQAVEDRIVALVNKDRTVYINVKEVVKKATGGLIGGVQKFARGGRLAGYGGGDRISALLEAGEFVIRKEAVAKFGSGMFAALNSLRMPEIPRFAVGGPVGMASSGSGEMITVNMNFGPGRSVPVMASRTGAAELIREMNRMQRLTS